MDVIRDYLHCACVGTPMNLCVVKFRPDGVLRVILAILSLRMRRNAQNTTFGLEIDFVFRTGMSQNL
jgi:hypothetical protein